MGFLSLSNDIKTRLQALPQLKAAHAYHHTDLPGYPSATFEAGALENEFISNTDNYRGYGFNIIIHQSMEKPIGREKGLENLYIAVDAVIAALDGDYDFLGNTDINDPVRAQFGEYVLGNGTVKYAVLTITLRKEELV